MRRIRTDWRGWPRGLLTYALVLGVPLHGGPARAQDDAGGSERALAREHFAKGVALAKARAYAEALFEFEQAYAAVPHFSVLYNIGQAQLALRQSDRAVATLQRYLDEGGASIDAKRRAEVEATLARERSLLPTTPEPSEAAEPPAAAPTAPAPSATFAPAPASVPAQAPAPAEAPTATRPAVLSPVAPPIDLARHPLPSAPLAPELRRTLALVVGGVGVALAGGALTHYLWNRGRYHDWQGKYSTYYRDPTEPNRSAANALSKSIDDASAVTFVLAVGAGVALGTGGVLWLTSAPGADVRRGRIEPLIGAGGTF